MTKLKVDIVKGSGMLFVTEPLEYWYRLYIIGIKDRSYDTTKQESKLKTILEKYKGIIIEKKLSEFPVDAVEKINDVGVRFPNFKILSKQIIKLICLSRLTGKGFAKLPHILLVGAPGSGKTVFAKKLINILSKSQSNVNFGMINSAFELAGLNLGWDSGDAGLLAKNIALSENANIFYLADELDKGSSSNERHGSAFNILYQVWEKSASSFYDEGLGMNIDLSHCTWICTANDIDKIPEPLLSRLHVIHVELPDKNQMRIISQSIWDELILDEGWDDCFSRTLSKELVDKLITYTPRYVVNTLKHAAASAAYRSREKQFGNQELHEKIILEERDISQSHTKKDKHKMGFIN